MICFTNTISLVYVSVIFSFVSGIAVNPCRVNDDNCILQSAKDLVSQALATPDLDPLHLDKIDGKLSILSYIFKNATITGFKSCSLKSLEFPLNELIKEKQTDIHADLECQRAVLTGDYEIEGTLVVLPVTGKGFATVDLNKLKVGVNANMRIEKGKDNQNHFHIKNFSVKPEIIGGAKYDFKNLFNGQKDLSDAVHKFANEQWKEVANIVQDPIFITSFKAIVAHMNKFLKTVPVESLYVQ